MRRPRASEAAEEQPDTPIEPRPVEPPARKHHGWTGRDPTFEAALGARLRAARVAAGLTQLAMGNALGVSFQQIQKYERGIDRVAASTLRKIGHVLGVHPGSFFDDVQAPVGDIVELRDVMAAATSFQRVHDPIVRNRLLALVEELTKEDVPGT